MLKPSLICFSWSLTESACQEGWGEEKRKRERKGEEEERKWERKGEEEEGERVERMEGEMEGGRRKEEETVCGREQLGNISHNSVN